VKEVSAYHFHRGAAVLVARIGVESKALDVYVFEKKFEIEEMQNREWKDRLDARALSVGERHLRVHGQVF